MEPLQIWGGIECTVNRVRDRYSNQLKLSGHWQRADDLEQIAALGLRTLRYPVLWETVAPQGLNEPDWSRSDAALAKLRESGVRPIVGLLHHGSGPQYTDLLDPEFPQKFANYAEAVARRYPWVDAYTPINEPLTTARFSGLYGHWYPHLRDARSFAVMLLNQLKATVLAMECIRKVNPKAELIQTEDLGRTFSTPGLRYQAEFENERRWLTWDLLSGRVDDGSRMADYFRWVGLAYSELAFFRENPCPPDLVGINYYVTSERYLDENIEHYPPELHGNNGRHIYADDAAVRARSIGLAGPKIILGEAWNRYRRPVAFTEIHLGSSPDQQIQWFLEAWHAARAMRQRGAEVRAVTAWALLGSFDWDSLVTRNCGYYESGAFEIQRDRIAPTALATLLRGLAHGGSVPEMLANERGWWRRRERLREFSRTQAAA